MGSESVQNNDVETAKKVGTPMPKETYQMECVVTEVVLGEDILFSFEPTSKYQLKINGKTIYVAVDSKVSKFVAVPSENLSRVKLDVAVQIAFVLRQGSSVVLEVNGNGKPVAFTK